MTERTATKSKPMMVHKTHDYAFSLDQDEAKKFEDWKRKHDKSCRYAKRGSCGAIGGRFDYCFAPTSLGIVVKVQCACGSEVDLTDYQSW